MQKLSNRLEIRLNNEQLMTLEEESRRRHKPISTLVRHALEQYYPPRRARVARRLKAVKALGSLNAAVSSWEQMEEEIVKGRLD